MSLSQRVRELERAQEDLIRRVNDARTLLETVGEKDPRSSGFIAQRVLERLFPRPGDRDA